MFGSTLYGLEDALVRQLSVGPRGLRQYKLKPSPVPGQAAQPPQTYIPPNIFAGSLPSNIFGYSGPNRQPNYPCVIIKAIAGRYDRLQGQATVRIFVGVFDDNADRQGHRDVEILLQAILVNLTERPFVGNVYPLLLDVESQFTWEMIEPAGMDMQNIFMAQMMVHYGLQTPGDMPDVAGSGVVMPSGPLAGSGLPEPANDGTPSVPET